MKGVLATKDNVVVKFIPLEGSFSLLFKGANDNKVRN